MPTKIIGRRFYIYASKKWAVGSGRWAEKAWSDDLRVGRPPAWMIELAKQVGMIDVGALLPTGVIVGSAEIERVSQTVAGMWRWHLADVERSKRLRKPKGRPQPSWFTPF